LKKEKCHIVKIGGKLIDEPHLYQRILQSFSALEQKKILVHGGGKLGSDFLSRLNIPVQYHEGRRITDLETMDILVMVYGGSINKRITADLQKMGTDALGLSGCDLNIIQAEKRPVKKIDYGYAGDIKNIRIKRINDLLNLGAVPVISPITHNLNGQLLNTNADTVASALATALADLYEVELHFCFELPGVLEDVSKPSSLIQEMNYQEYLRLREHGIIHQGMLPKLHNSFQALQENVRLVTIGEPEHFLNGTNHTTLTL
jgi:acetylglutamate kinase